MNIKEKVQNIFPGINSIPAENQLKSRIDQKEFLVNGVIHEWNGEMQTVLSPICVKTEAGVEQQVIGSYPMLTEAESLAALDAAVNAYDSGRGKWPTMMVEERIKAVEHFIVLMKEKREEVIQLLMWEIGKNLSDSAKEFDRTVEYIVDTIEALKELDRTSSRFTIKDGIFAQIRRAPLGVVLCMGPFNYPLNETFTTLIPALMMGNTIIFKAPKYGVLLHRPLLTAFQQAFPAGVVNTVYGDGPKVIGPLMTSGKIDTLAFIGTSRVADILKKQHPKPHRMRGILGLEAKNAGIVLADADLDLAVKECVLGSLSFNGQRCTAIKVIFVHQQIVDQFIQKFCAEISILKPGMPWEEKVQLTPMPEGNKIDWMNAYISDAITNGAKVVNEFGGESNKTFMFPAVLYPVNSKMKIYTEEQFGPIIPIVPFTDLNEPLNYVVDSNYGQQVAIFGKDPKMIAQLIDPLVNQVCRVNVNSQCQRGPDIFPFTGRKDSAEGTLSVSDALRAFSIRTMVAAKHIPSNKTLFTNIMDQNLSNFLSTDFIL